MHISNLIRRPLNWTGRKRVVFLILVSTTLSLASYSISSYIRYAKSYVPLVHFAYLDSLHTHTLTAADLAYWGEALPSPGCYSPTVEAFAVSPNGTRLACIDTDDSVRVWSLPGFTLIGTWKLPNQGQTAIAWDNSGNDVIVNDGVKIERIVSAPSASAIPIIINDNHPAKDVIALSSLSPNGKLAAAAYENGSLRVTNCTSGQIITLPLPPSRHSANGATLLSGFAFSPDSTKLIAAYDVDDMDVQDYDASRLRSFVLRIYDANTGSVDRQWSLKSVCFSPQWLNDVLVAMSPDDQYVAVIARYGKAEVWRASTLEKVSDLSLSDTGCKDLQFINNSPFVAVNDINVNDIDDGISLWNYKTGLHVHTFHDPNDCQHFAVSKDGKYIASDYHVVNESDNNEDNYIDIWDVNNAR